MSKEFPEEKLLVKVIDDLADFLPYLVLVGGWVPYIYARYIWKNVLIEKRKEGKQVKENLKRYFSSVDSKGPLFAEQENGPDAYINNVRQDAFDKFSGIRRRVEE